jgi:bacillithiol system protein YtxJ
MSWQELKSEEELKRLLEEKPIKFAIFKHSSRCGVSSWVKRSFQSDWKSKFPDVDIFEVDVVRNRELSQLIADKFKVYHESPQLIVIDNGKVVHHNSHNNIEADSLTTIKS